ncbi:hypothetical protein GXP70_15360 [Paenibacillus lycopersici]|uniref:Uncharacterized protein n=1 Tax=Paenibacillus lycopersici TaxID=2704462 RepID=A0A6C0G3G2_9BACL|nr:hypothetical protein [Paenibacillus lycopersici]QHT61200.1 hypothetical protein GXP70_15360 [Paenibacillus lycopersici]
MAIQQSCIRSRSKWSKEASGSGKITLARAVYGLIPDDAVEGTVLINGYASYGNEGAGLMQQWADAVFIDPDPVRVVDSDRRSRIDRTRSGGQAMQLVFGR